MKLERRMEEEREPKRKEAVPETMDLGNFERVGEMESIWIKGTQALAGLEQVPRVLAKLERARKAVEVVESM